MSFGWSAGDIAKAITLTYNLIKALDTADGAAGDYRKAVTFLQDLKRTLEPLQTFTAWNVNPVYSKDIGEQVAHIKEPVETFLASILKYEPSLGARAREGRHRHIFRKLQWYIFTSNKVLELKKQIKTHMRVIDTLMQRLTVDLVQVTQQQLPDTLRTVMQQTLRPELMTTLQECLLPLKLTLVENVEALHNSSHTELATKWSECHEELRMNMRKIEEDMLSSRMTQMRIESCLRGDIPRGRQPALPASELSGQIVGEIDGAEDKTSSQVGAPLVTPKMVRDSLTDVYYLVFLYLGHFLQNLFLVLSRMVQPTQALTPVLLAQYNISFLDAIGRPPRILPFEYFRSFKVLQAFIQHEFKDLPGSAWVDQGRYLVSSMANNCRLDERNWSGSIAPGATVAMSMVVRKRLGLLYYQMDQCPQLNCPGTWARLDTQSWVTCPICQKQILNSVPSIPSSAKESSILESSNLDSSKNPPETDQHSNTSRAAQPIGPTPLPVGEIDEIELYFDEDISLFKRVSEEIVNFRPKSSNPASRVIRSITIELPRLVMWERLLMTLVLPSLCRRMDNKKIEGLQKQLQTEILILKDVESLLFPSTSPTDQTSVIKSENEAWQMGSVFKGPKQTPGSAAFNYISSVISSICLILDGVISLLPDVDCEYFLNHLFFGDLHELISDRTGIAEIEFELMPHFANLQLKNQRLRDFVLLQAVRIGILEPGVGPELGAWMPNHVCDNKPVVEVIIPG